MLKVRVIPCLDVKDGRVVKGVNFVDLRDAGDPVEAAIAYDAAGADELWFLDITASQENRDTMLDVVSRTAGACFMPLTVGGGVRTLEDMRELLLRGGQGLDQHRGGDARRSRRRRGEVRRPVHRRRARCRRADRATGTLGDLHPWRHAGDRDRRRSATPRGGARGAGEILLTSMDRDGAGRLQPRADPRGRRRRRSR